MILLLSSLRSVMVCTGVISFFGVMNVGEAHWDDDCLFMTPMDTSLVSSFIRLALCICGMGYGLPWYGLAPSFTSIETGGQFESSSVPSKINLYSSSNESSFSLCDKFLYSLVDLYEFFLWICRWIRTSTFEFVDQFKCVLLLDYFTNRTEQLRKLGNWLLLPSQFNLSGVFIHQG